MLSKRASFALVLSASVLASRVACALPAGPFGNALPDESGFGVLGWFPRLIGPFVSAQIWFQRELTSAVHAVAQDRHALWALIGLSFIYGVLHAVGPGHGKAVVTSYVLATRQTLRNGLLLAFLSSVAQTFCAIAIAGVASRIFHLTSVGIANATVQMEVLADVTILFLGLRLVWLKVWLPVSERLAVRTTSAAFASTSGEVRLPVASRFQAAAAETAIADHPLDCDCGRVHLPPAEAVAGALNWGRAWMVLATTGLRPCSGALIVLAFSLSQGVFAAGIGATVAMGLGTFVMVAVLATLAVGSRAGTVTLPGSKSVTARRLARGIEAAAAIAILLFAILLLTSHIVIESGVAG